ncbi:MAG: glutathione S-transferase family protein [Rhodospirillales bacterium]|nr:glutathione S-transferase family protein [Rhodospirillales bacterium]MBT4039128.1 glutathione S-transferase family protein [Rhodospirillales bacterium]MBT4625529.1 glutathione S-transferase family protein [Rhodospirillales bacterium]MBT5352167.1 glutathione S-transferase family protein [Rhodospirillales bacterium]MBT5521936.1 glutathione S-transferase family protein [Rhodospirillales bacterium]
MRTLYHLWLSPFCRATRVAMGEKKLEFHLQTENIWDRREEFLSINPAGEVPVLTESDGSAISGCEVIFEYLEEAYPNIPLLPRSPLARAETRRLVHWFNTKFNNEVTENLLGEKMMKRFLGLGEPDAAAIRAGYRNLRTHMDYISYLVERRNWIVGDELSYADVVAAAHISALDYIGEMPWEENHVVKTWYSRIKSRPSFRPLLGDHIPGAPPPKHYADLDF